MPALAIYIGAHEVSGLVYISPAEMYYYSFPYVYSQKLFHNFANESAFYKAIFEMFCKQSKVKLSDCDILVTGFVEPPSLDMKLKYYASISEVLQRIENYYPILVNNFGVATSERLFSEQKLYTDKGTQLIDPNEAEFYANLMIYPQMTITDTVARADLDQNILEMTKGAQFNIPRLKQIVFMGSRFNSYNTVHELNHILILNIINQPGIFQIFVDPKNSTLLTQLVRIYIGDSANISPDVIKIGTLISVKNSLECMISTQVGTSQIVDLEKEKVFILPLAKDERAKISLKVQSADNIEEYITGGTLGVIFDTRENKGDIVNDYKLFSTSIKAIGNSTSI